MNFFPYRYSAWSIPHGFFPGQIDGRDLGVQYEDDHTHLKNRRDIVSSLGLDSNQTVFSYQVHGKNVQVIEHVPEIAPQCDGMVTRIPGITLGVSTADCAPVMFWDGDQAIGICHSGWKGTLYGVLEQTLTAIRSISAHSSRIQACIGPTIRSQNYEVSSEFYSLFVKEDKNSVSFFGEGDFLYFDLPGYIGFRLTQSKCTVFDSMENTFKSRFYSKRWQNKEHFTQTKCFGSIIGTLHH